MRMKFNFRVIIKTLLGYAYFVIRDNESYVN